MSTFGEWLRNQRNERRLTREEFSQRVGCSVAMLRKIEADERRPSAQIAALLASALEVPQDQQATFVRVARGELGVARLSSVSSAPVSPPVSPVTNLPAYPTPLIGRHGELAKLCQLLADPQCRLLTLVGPGGIGKTRLAVEAGSQLQSQFADGVYFVPLAPVDSDRFIVPVLAHSIGFAFLSARSAEPKTQLINYLQGKRMLLLFDNVEHLLGDATLELFGELLAEAPDVQLLMTSRECLGLQAEWVFEVQGLPVPLASESRPDTVGNSVELFLQRARRAHVGFDATTEDYPAIVRICESLGGAPLAIELAAAWVRTLSCEEIATEIDSDLDFLRTTARDLPPRHRSMRAAFNHSWELLSAEERRALARLSVFRGGFSREVAEQVAGASLGMLAALAAKSLVRRPETGRYDLHELIRQYAAEYLDRDPSGRDEAQRQHFAFYLSMAEAAAPRLKDSSQLETLHQLEQEHDNFRAALVWALSVEQSGEAALQLASALRWFCAMRGYFDEGRLWLEKALARGEHTKNRLARARAMEGLALLENSVGHHAAARELAGQSAAIYRELGDKHGLADALMTIGQALRWEGDEALSHIRLEEALGLYRELGDRWNIAWSLFRLGQDLTDFGGDVPARAMLQESATLLEELGDSFILIGVLNSLALLAANPGDYAAARSYLGRALFLAHKMSDPWGIADTLTNLASVLRTQGDYSGARLHLEEALRVYEQSGRGTWCADPLCALAENEMAQGHLSAAREFLQDASSWALPSGNRWLHVLVQYFEGLLAYYEGKLVEAGTLLEQTVELSRASQYKPDLARSLVSLARVWLARGERELAIAPAAEALRLYSGSSSLLGVATALEVFAGMETTANPERSVRWFGATEGIRSSIGVPMPPIDQPALERELAAARSQVGETPFAAAWARGQAERLETVVAEVLASYATE